MKKVICGILAVLACGCGKTEPPASQTALDPLAIELSCRSGSVNLSWQRPEGEDIHYDVLIRTVSGADGGNAGDIMYIVSADNEFFRAAPYIAYYAQENDYYGPVSFQVTARDGDQAIAQGSTDTINAQEAFPAKAELMLGEEVSLEDITAVIYRGSGSAAEDNFIFDLIKDEEEYMISADYDDEEGRQSIEKPVEEAAFEGVKAFLEGGRIYRMAAEDPELEVLDGSDTSYALWWDGMSGLERTWYRFAPAEENREPLEQYLLDLCK